MVAIQLCTSPPTYCSHDLHLSLETPPLLQRQDLKMERPWCPRISIFQADGDAYLPQIAHDRTKIQHSTCRASTLLSFGQSSTSGTLSYPSSSILHQSSHTND